MCKKTMTPLLFLFFSTQVLAQAPVRMSELITAQNSLLTQSASPGSETLANPMQSQVDFYNHLLGGSPKVIAAPTAENSTQNTTSSPTEITSYLTDDQYKQLLEFLNSAVLDVSSLVNGTTRSALTQVSRTVDILDRITSPG